MLGLIFLLAAVTSVINTMELLDYNNDNNIYQGTTETGKKTDEHALKDDVAILKEMILKQGQEISSLKMQHEQEISGLKQQVSGMKQEIYGLREEMTLLNRKTSEQDELIYSQEKVITRLENVVQKQTEKVAELLGVTKLQSNKLTLMENVIEKQEKKISELVNKRNSENPLEKGNIDNDKDLTHITGSKTISSTKLFKKQGLAVPNIVRESRISPSTNVAFSAYLDHNLLHLTSGYLIKCNKALLNVGNVYNTITGLFTVPQTGVYLLTFTINTRGGATAARTFVKLVSNNRNIIDAVSNLPAYGDDQMGGNTAIVQLSAGESVWLEVFATTTGELQSDETFRYVSFSGVLLF